MQEQIEFLMRTSLFGSLGTLILFYFMPTANKIRMAIFIGHTVVSAVLAAWYFAERGGHTSFAAGHGGDFAILTALCLWGSLGIVLYVGDLYYNIDVLRDDRAYNIFGDIGLAVTTVVTAPFALCLAVIPWFLSDSTLFEIKSTIRYVDGVESLEATTLLDLLWFSFDQTGKAVLFDVAEVYRFGITNLSNNPEHLTFSTVCLIYRTLVAVYVAVIAYRLIFERK
jgi:hypothetical protein